MLDIDDIIEELLAAANLEGSEWGEAIENLCQLHHYADFLNPEFVEHLETEIKYQYVNFKEYAEIVEEEEVTKRTIKRIEWSS